MTTRSGQTNGRPLAAEDTEKQTDVLSRLTDLLERRWRTPVERKHTFEPPSVNGEGDVELFVKQFSDVAVANDWTQPGTLLHLRTALRDGATDCGRASTAIGIFTALRARYGLSPREARARLVSLTRDSKTSLHQHGVEVERLVELAYADLPENLRRTMVVDKLPNWQCAIAT